MQLTRRISEIIVFLDPQGELRVGEDLDSLPLLAQELIQKEDRNYALDTDLIPCLDRAGLGAILLCYASVRRAGGALKMWRPSDRILEIFQVANMQNPLEWRLTEESLRQSFSGQDY